MVRRPLLLAAACVAVAGCGRPREANNVVLVTLDTTRADWIGSYGRPDVRTPALDRLARSGTTFAQTIADVPVTLPSHTTLMTGVPAITHGVRYNADFRVGDRARTLAERLAAAGYDTGAVVSTLVLDARFGLDQGFTHYDDDLTEGYVRYDLSLYPEQTHWLPKADRRAAETADRALEWMRGATRPFLLWAHFYDPHFPFDPPPPWGASHAHPYGAEIQFTDRQVGRLLAGIRERGLQEATVVVVTADHGEGLDQHREDGHGIFVYDETVRVPLIIHAPGPPTVPIVSGQVRSVDVASTVLELAGLRGTLGIGRSLVGAMAGRPSGSRPAYAYSESIKSKLFYGGTGLKALRTDDFKFIWAPAPEIYDLRTDPGETHNLAGRDPARVRELRNELGRVVRDLLDRERVFALSADLDEDAAEKLRSLGYVSGSGGVAPGTPEEELALQGNDPKDLVDVSMAAREIQNGFPGRAEQKLRRFFATARRPEDDPRMTRLWAAAHLNAAKIRFDRTDYAAAAEQYEQAVRADPTYAQARWRWIYALNLAGRAPEAVREATTLLAVYPGAWRVRLHLGLALALAQRAAEAGRELTAVAGSRDAPDDVARAARYYLDRLSTSEESDALERYRSPAG